MRDQIIHIVQGPGRQSHGLGTERREWILDSIENLNKMFIPLLTSDTRVTITLALISAQGLLHRPFQKFSVFDYADMS